MQQWGDKRTELENRDARSVSAYTLLNIIYSEYIPIRAENIELYLYESGKLNNNNAADARNKLHVSSTDMRNILFQTLHRLFIIFIVCSSLQRF